MKWRGAKGKDFTAIVDKALAVTESATVDPRVDATKPEAISGGTNNKKVGEELLDAMFDVHRHQLTAGERF